jgi:hypothetical protein
MTTEQVLALVRKLNKSLELQKKYYRVRPEFEFAAVLSQSEDVINLGPLRVTKCVGGTVENAIWQINDELNEFKETIDVASDAVGALIKGLNKAKKKPAFIPVKKEKP